MTRVDDVAQSPSPTKPKWGQPAPPAWAASQVLVPFQFPLCQCVNEGRCTGYPMPKVGGGRVRWPASHMYGRPARVWWVTTSNQWWSSLTPPINTPIPPSARWRSETKVYLPIVLPSSFFVEWRQRGGSEGWRTSWLVGTPPSSSSAEALLESVWVHQSFPSSSSIKCGSSARILWILTEN
jgi:hypothetical protein